MTYWWNLFLSLSLSLSHSHTPLKQLIASGTESMRISSTQLSWCSFPSFSSHKTAWSLSLEIEERERRRGWTENKKWNGWEEEKLRNGFMLLEKEDRPAAKHFQCVFVCVCVCVCVFWLMTHTLLWDGVRNSDCLQHCGGGIPILTRGPHAVTSVRCGFSPSLACVNMCVCACVRVWVFSASSPPPLILQQLLPVFIFPLRLFSLVSFFSPSTWFFPPMVMLMVTILSLS